ncbi:MAG: spermidine synthase [Candidatus Rokuibacteriota bacterium]
MALPLLGGAPAVWNTALVFYQTVLLAGYAYAHASTRWLGVGRQAALHLVVLAAALPMLPLAIPRDWTPPTDSNPVPWLLAVLAASVGLPFFALSASSPLLQRWLAGTAHPAAADPYFLYGASNLGSLVALLAYPALLEPTLPLDSQSRLWAAGYVVAGLLTAGCAVFVWRAPARGVARNASRHDTAPHDGLPVGRRLRWILLALVPASMMIGVTTYLSTDIAAIPLLWVIPLAIYLLTFILVFARRSPLSHRLMASALPLALLPLVMVLAARANEPIALVIPAHLAAFFVVAMVCHGELARDRPPTPHLTEFYLWLSTGGVLGGILAALVAPLIFTTAVEYAVAPVLACLLAAPRDSSERGWRLRALDVGLPVALGVVAIGLLAGVGASGRASPASAGLVVGVLAVITLSFARRPARFGLGVGALLMTSTLFLGPEGVVLHAERSFFGIHRVTQDSSGGYHLLLHGTTLHGLQSLDPSRRREPLAYFHSDGPIGQLFRALGPIRAQRPIAVVGLGAGSLACHGAPGQRWTFYEIDPAVERIARDPRYFTFLRDCPPAIDVVLGDARRSLTRVPAQRYGMIILDAYGSDAPPVHLITREALALYLDKLTPDGILVFNITNRHLDLEPVLGNLARDAGLLGLVRHDTEISDTDRARGRMPSRWVVLARRPIHLAPLAADARWRTATYRPDARVWTDDFSALWRAFAW